MWPHGHVSDGNMEVLAAGHVPWLRFIGMVSRVAADGMALFPTIYAFPCKLSYLTDELRNIPFSFHLTGHSHLGLSTISYMKATELFLYRPSSSIKTQFGIDGELYQAAPPGLFVSVHHSLARIYAPSEGRFQTLAARQTVD